MAAEAPVTTAAPFMQPDLFTSAVKTFSVLFILLALILIALYLVKRFWPNGAGLSGGTQWLKVIASAPLAPKKMISLVEVAGEVVVLGLTEQNITMLTKVAQGDALQRMLKHQGRETHHSPFYEQLKALMSGHKAAGGGEQEPLRSAVAVSDAPDMPAARITVPGLDS